jgi:bifunctional non-homologous end joining protein LigD
VSSLPVVTPMAPTLAKPFHRPGWVYEEKYDGWRMVGYKDGSTVRLISRNAADHIRSGYTG